jgi:molecular chaperone DnaK (HSP70)
MAAAGDWGETSIDVLRSWTTPANDLEGIPQLDAVVDSIEPIAAAVELLPTLASQRRVCAVVDVGAGTSDIGVFQQLVPDERAGKAVKLIPAGPATSVFKAGDAIDQALMDFLQERYPAAYRANAGAIRADIRGHKKNLFLNGRIQLPGIDLALEDFQRATAIQGIASEIRNGLVQCMYDSRERLKAWLSPGAPIDRRILVVMAGGGAGLAFLQRALLEPLLIDGVRYEFEPMVPTEPRGLNMHGAGHSRLAVGLGGVHEGYDDLVHEHGELSRIPNLGRPKQTVGRW